MSGSEAISALKAKFGVSSDQRIATLLGISAPMIQTWKNREEVTAKQFAALVYSASKKGAVVFQSNIIRPLVEFFPIERGLSRYGAKYELFAIKDENGQEHPYRIGLRQELEAKNGVYLFFDSRGEAIYVGKARRQSLWKEMNLAFNRQRGNLQTIKRVRHPERKQSYQTSDEKSRQIDDYQICLFDIAAYFGAYEVADALINDVEALLVRSFANNLLNKRMERFSSHYKISK